MPTRSGINYTTKEEILAAPPGVPIRFTSSADIVQHLVPYLKDWRRELNWKESNAPQKSCGLENLLWDILESLGVDQEDVEIQHDSEEPSTLDRGADWMDDPRFLITLDIRNPSIISTLHELGHVLYGTSELEACRFSVWLFRAAFPRAYDKLVWEGHMLKRPVPVS